MSYQGWIGDIRIIFSEKVSTYKFNEVEPRLRNTEPDRNYNIMVEYFTGENRDNRTCIGIFDIEDMYGDRETGKFRNLYEYILKNLEPYEKNEDTLKLEGIEYARSLLKK